MDLFQTIKTNYDLLVETRKADFNKRRAEIIEKYPEIDSLYAKQAKLWLEHFKGSISNDSLEKELSKCENELVRFLHKYNLDISDLEYIPQCDVCQDTGYNEYGNVCVCLKQKFVDACYKQSNIERLIQIENFDTFDENLFSDIADNQLSPRENILKAKARLIQFVENFNEKGGYLLIQGKVGVGKSFLTHCVTKELIDSGKTVIYLTAYNLIDIMTDISLRRNDEISTQLLYECDLLIIDDLGSERQTDFSVMQIFNLLNERIIKNKAVVISTNLTVGEIESLYDERITSRIMGCFSGIKLYGDDIRVSKKKIK